MFNYYYSFRHEYADKANEAAENAKLTLLPAAALYTYKLSQSENADNTQAIFICSNITMNKGSEYMKVAKPIKDLTILKEVLDVYPTNSRNQLLLLYCLNTGLRISDVLTAKVGESVLGKRELTEQKTGKRKVIALPDKLIQRIRIYVQQERLEMDDWLFRANTEPIHHIKRSRADKIIRYAGDMVGITLSAHSLRKTFGYWAYQNGTNLEYLMLIFNHASAQTTLRYIGIEQENIDEFYKSVDIGL